jgi:orotate phosphoribosyltransferase
MSPELKVLLRALVDIEAIFHPRAEPSSIDIDIKILGDEPLRLLVQCILPVLEGIEFHGIASVVGNGTHLALTLEPYLGGLRQPKWMIFSEGASESEPVGDLFVRDWLKPDTRMLAIDLLVGRGRNLVQLVKAVQEQGFEVRCAVALSERMHCGGAKEALEALGVELRTVTSIEEIQRFCRESGLQLVTKDA